MASEAKETSTAEGRTVLLVNARARLGRAAESEVAAALRRNGLGLDRVVRVRRPRSLHRAVEILLYQHVSRLIVGGGDGTLGTVAAQLAGTGIALGVIPLGTANDFARTLEIPLRLEEAAGVAAGTHVREVDLAQANGHHFLNVASVGMSVAALGMLSPGMKRWLGPASYAVAGALAFARHPTFHARIDSPAGSTSGDVHQVVVGNGRFYGGGVLVAGGSTLDDGTLAVYTLGRLSRWGLLKTVALLRFKVPLNRPGDIFLQTPTVHLATTPTGLPVNLDGEIRTRTPVTIRVEPGALRVLTPSP